MPSIRTIVRPDAIRATPRRLKTILQATRTIRLSDVVQCDYSRDLLIGLPPPAKVLQAPDEYTPLFSFYSANKKNQRSRLIQDGLPVVPTLCPANEELLNNGLGYVVRPLNHRQGQGFRRTFNPDDFNQSTEYISTFICKTKEFRIICYKGHKVCTYLKKTPDGLGADEPWTHANGCRFLTINNIDNDPLERTDLYSQLANHWIVKTAHLLAVDVLWSERQPFICEFNFAPGLTINSTFNRIKEIDDDR